MDLALNNVQRLICHKTQPTNSSDTNEYQEEMNGLRDNLHRNKFAESITPAPRIMDRTTAISENSPQSVCQMSKALLKRSKRYVVYMIPGQY